MKKELYLILLGALIPRLLAAFFSQGFNHPDEHFQILEPAFGLFSGYWTKTWEWELGMRSYFLPHVFAFLLRIGQFLSLDHPLEFATFLRIVVAFYSLLSVAVTYPLTLLLSRGDRGAARLATFLMAWWWLPVYFSVRTLSEVLVIPLLLVAHFVFLRMKPIDKNISLIGAGVLLGICFWMRFQMGIFIAGLALTLLFPSNLPLTLKDRIKKLTLFSSVIVVMVVLHGILDYQTWGSFLHSPMAYVQQNLVLGKMNSDFGVDPWHRYLTTPIRFFTATAAPLFLFFFFWALKKKSRQDLQGLVIFLFPPFVFFLVHQSLGHKEDRFLLPLVPYVFIASSLGFSLWWKKMALWPRRLPVAATLAVVLLGSNIYKYFHNKWNNHADIVLPFADLHDKKDVTGLLVWGRNIGGTGGHFYLKKNIPLVVYPDGGDQLLPTLLSQGKIPRPLNYLLLEPARSSPASILRQLKAHHIECHPVGMENHPPPVNSSLFKCQ